MYYGIRICVKDNVQLCDFVFVEECSDTNDNVLCFFSEKRSLVEYVGENLISNNQGTFLPVVAQLTNQYHGDIVKDPARYIDGDTFPVPASVLHVHGVMVVVQ